MTKFWQSMQSRSTKNLNLEKDLEDIESIARRVGWCIGSWKKKCKVGAWEKIDSQGFPLQMEALDVQ